VREGSRLAPSWNLLAVSPRRLLSPLHSSLLLFLLIPPVYASCFPPETRCHCGARCHHHRFHPSHGTHSSPGTYVQVNTSIGKNIFLAAPGMQIIHHWPIIICIALYYHMRFVCPLLSYQGMPHTLWCQAASCKERVDRLAWLRDARAVLCPHLQRHHQCQQRQPLTLCAFPCTYALCLFLHLLSEATSPHSLSCSRAISTMPTPTSVLLSPKTAPIAPSPSPTALKHWRPKQNQQHHHHPPRLQRPPPLSSCPIGLSVSQPPLQQPQERQPQRWLFKMRSCRSLTGQAAKDSLLLPKHAQARRSMCTPAQNPPARSPLSWQDCLPCR